MQTSEKSRIPNLTLSLLNNLMIHKLINLLSKGLGKHEVLLILCFKKIKTKLKC